MLQAGNAPVVANYTDAEAILKDVQRTRANLEANLDIILRSKSDLDVYGLIDELAKEGLNSERMRIMKMVDVQIAKMGPQMQKEMLADILKMEEKEQFRKEMMQRLIPERDTNVQTQVPGKPGQRNQSRPTVAQTRTTGMRARANAVESRVNTGLKKPAWQKENVPARTAKPKKSASSAYQTEAYVNRVYGKSVGQPARSTQRGAQFRQASVATRHSPISHKGVEKAKPLKTAQRKSHFYFDAQHPGDGLSAPVQGQLVPMAIPLGAPRQQGGALPPQYVPSTPQVTLSHIITSTPVTAPPPGGAKTGIVTFKEIDDDDKKERLTTQTEDETSESSILDEYSHDSEAIALPGYHHPTPAKYHGPSFPPQAPSLRPVGSGELAVDIGAKDSIQHTAMQWIEQELMARILSEIAENRNVRLASEQERQRAAGERHVNVEPDEVSEITEDSASSSHHDSLLAEAVGQEGLQLFVNAGVPLDESLVNKLIKEVLLETAGTMLGQRTGDEQSTQTERIPSPKPRPRSPSKVTTPRAESPVKATIRSPVPTPEPTPVASPVLSPKRLVSPPPDPDLSPATSQAEAKPREQAAAYVDESTEEDVTLPPMPAPTEEVPEQSSPLISRHDVLTPIITPRDEAEKPYTPEPSVEDTPPQPQILQSPEKPDLQDATTQYQESFEEEESESMVEAAIQTTPPPSPVLQEKKISPIVSPESSLSEIQMENISEGQWLVSGLSEGEVRPPLQFTGVGFGIRPPAVGSEPDDTLYEADDLDQDLDHISEGEFLHRGPVDPRLLAAMSEITNQPVRLIEQILQQQNLLPQPQPQPARGILKGRSGDLPQSRSAGEVVSGEVPSAGQVIQVGGADVGTARAFSAHLHRQSSQDIESPGEFEHEKPKYPVASPRKRSAGSAASGSSAELRQHTPEPAQPSSQSQDSVEASLSESRDLSGSAPREPQMRLTVGGRRTGALSGPIMATDAPSRSRRGARGGRGGSRPSMSVSRSFSPPPEAGATDNSVDATATSGVRLIQVAQSMDSELRDTLDDLRETGGSVEFGGGTRTMTPDQMNIEALLQSRDYFNTGTQSEFESTGGIVRENTGRSQEFGGTGTLRRQGTFNLEDTDSDGKVYMSRTQDSMDVSRPRQSSDFPGDQTSESAMAYRQANQYKSEDYDDTLGRTSDSADMRGSMQYPDSLEGTANYGTYAQTLEAMYTQSEGDIDMMRRTGPIALSVTIPSMEQSESAAEESDVSEFSIGKYSPTHG